MTAWPVPLRQPRSSQARPLVRHRGQPPPVQYSVRRLSGQIIGERGCPALALGRREGTRRCLPGGRAYPTRVFTAAVISARAFLASAKYMLVLELTYSSLSMPA